MIPAFTPNPARKRRKTTACVEPVNLADDAAKLEKSRLPATEFRSRKPIVKHPVPACDMAKNRTPACRVISFRCSNVIKQYAVSAMASHAIREKNAFDAVKTTVRLSKDQL